MTYKFRNDRCERYLCFTRQVPSIRVSPQAIEDNECLYNRFSVSDYFFFYCAKVCPSSEG